MHVGVYLVDGVFDSGLAILTDILTTANALAGAEVPSVEPWQVTLLGSSVHTSTGAGLRATTVPTAKLDRALDLLVVPALAVKEPRDLVTAVSSDRTRSARRFIAGTYASGVPVAAACTSTFLLAQAGILDGAAATTSWWLGPVFRKRYPAVRLDETRTLVYDQGRTTAGAAFAHIDLALSIVMARTPAVADLVARHLLLDTRPSQATYAMPTMLAGHHPLVASFERWVRTHVDEVAGIAQAARALRVSERTLQRAVADTLGMTPIEFVQEIRLDEATRLLRTTSLTVETIARRVGYRNTASLRQVMRRRRHTTLGAIRRRSTTGAVDLGRSQL